MEGGIECSIHTGTNSHPGEVTLKWKRSPHEPIYGRRAPKNARSRRDAWMAWMDQERRERERRARHRQIREGVKLAGWAALSVGAVVLVVLVWSVR